MGKLTKQIVNIAEQMKNKTNGNLCFEIDEFGPKIGEYCGETNRVKIGLKGCHSLALKLKNQGLNDTLVVKFILAHELGHSIDPEIETTSLKANEAVKLANKAAQDLDEIRFEEQSELFKTYLLKKERDAWLYAQQFLDEHDDAVLFSRVMNYCVRTYENDCDNRKRQGLHYIYNSKMKVENMMPVMKHGEQYLKTIKEQA